MASWQPFGYEGMPGTCLWCGRKLRHETVIDSDSDKPYPGNLVRADKSGRYQDDSFCGLSCGYRFGRRLAELGNRLQANKETQT